MRIDVLAFSPHPDDAEAGCGAFLLKMKKFGYTTGIVYMTNGDMGAGTPEQRVQEAREAGTLLQLDHQEFLDLGDCRLEDTHEVRVLVAGLLRRFRPRLLLVPYWNLPPGRGVGHRDHLVTSRIVVHAANFAHLPKYPADGEPYAADNIWYYMLGAAVMPTVLVPVDEEFPVALEAFRRHRSQVARDGGVLPELLEVSARRWGILAGCRYAQPFLPRGPLRLEDPFRACRGPSG